MKLDPKDLARQVMLFYKEFRVRGDDLMKKKTAENYKSFLRGYIMDQTDNPKIDIMDRKQCPGFVHFYKEYLRTLKKEGKCEVDHRKSITEKDLELLSEVGKLCHGILIGNPFEESFHEMLDKYAEMLPGFEKGKNR